MLSTLYPDVYYDSIFAIPYEELLRRRTKGLIFDVDNTLVPHDIAEPTQEIVTLFSSLRRKGFSICLLSNNNLERINSFNRKLGVKAVARAGKPGLQGIGKALKLLGVRPEQTALIGDQIFTDVWCGKRKKIYTILVKPVAKRDEFSVWLKRGLERIVLHSYSKERNKNGKPNSW